MAFKDWFKSLCGLILLMAFIEHPDMPKGLLGIQGLSPWNVLMACVVAGCAMSWKKEGLTWDMPKKFNVMLALFVLMMVISFVRLITDLDGIEAYVATFNGDMPSKAKIISEFFINSLKWLVPGALLFVGCRDEQRFRLGLYSVLAVYVLLALQIIRWMPISGLGGEDMAERALRVLSREVGFHRVDLSMILAGAFWALVATWGYVKSAVVRLFYPILLFTVFLGQALTGGRAGYVTWAAVGMAFAWLKWRRYLILGPIAIVLLLGFFPSVQDRMMQGFTAESVDDRGHDVEAEWIQSDDVDVYTVTAGRVIAWPMVIEKIKERPFVGYGRRAMQREGVATDLLAILGESFPHPHNAYLQFAFDTGLIGLAIALVMFFHFGIYAMRLLMDKESDMAVAVGGACLALMLALAVASMGSQTLYPREGTVGMWCAIGLMMRYTIQKLRYEQSQQSVPDSGTAMAEA